MSNPNRSADAATKQHNRVAAIMVHTRRYWSMGASLLAADAGVSKSTISHLVRGKSHPLYSTAISVVKCLERELGFRLDLDEVFSEDGTYPTPFICALARCPGLGCRPAIIWDEDANSVKPAFRFVNPGHWTGDNFEFEELSEQERSQ